LTGMCLGKTLFIKEKGEDMTTFISPFVETNKPWIIRKVIADYFHARNIFSKLSQDYHSGKELPFEKMKQFSELLYTAKEDLHLVFKRLIDPQHGEFEKAAKYTPNTDEIEFMNNVGLLFHKATVAREIKYMLEFYKTDTEDYAQLKVLLDNYVEKMRVLFSEGIRQIKLLLRDYKNNLVVMLYLVENEKYVTTATEQSLAGLLKEIEGNNEIDKKLIQIGKYCIQSGWPERAYTIFSKAIEYNPNNSEAKKYMAPSLF